MWSSSPPSGSSCSRLHSRSSSSRSPWGSAHWAPHSAGRGATDGSSSASASGWRSCSRSPSSSSASSGCSATPSASCSPRCTRSLAPSRARRRACRHRARPVGEHKRVREQLDGLSIAAGVLSPSCAVLRDPAPNCLTIGRRPETAWVIVTTGLVESLTRDELEAVLAYEIGRIAVREVSLDTAVYACTARVFELWAAPFAGLRARQLPAHPRQHRDGALGVRMRPAPPSRAAEPSQAERRPRGPLLPQPGGAALGAAKDRRRPSHRACRVAR